MIDKGQKEEMSVLAKAIKTGIAPIPFQSLLLNTYTAILAVESIQTKRNYTTSLEALVNE